MKVFLLITMTLNGFIGHKTFVLESVADCQAMQENIAYNKAYNADAVAFDAITFNTITGTQCFKGEAL